jgi:hypothetical protein
MFVSEITAFSLAKAVGEYLDSRRAVAAINESFQDAAHSSASSSSLLPIPAVVFARAQHAAG